MNRRKKDRLLIIVAVLGVVGLFVGGAIGVGGLFTIGEVRETGDDNSKAICVVVSYAERQKALIYKQADDLAPKLAAGSRERADELGRLGANMRDLVKTCPPPEEQPGDK